jgi:DNA processing protein
MQEEQRETQAIVELCRGELGWPEGLKTIEVEPARLWMRGRAELLGSSHCLAIVGSRAPTPYGATQAERFGRELAAAGACVVSGLARGVDAAAHAGALSARGATIGVLGCGVDRPWPSGRLAERMGSEGLLVSEFAPGTAPRRHHFPLRNRIIAGLSDAVLVVEAAEASGSLITARWAADQGQQVFVVPGRIDHPMARGTLALIREGATPVGSPQMLLDDLYGAGASGGDSDASELPFPARSPLELAILEALTGETKTAAEVAAMVHRNVREALGALTTLELDGAVRRAPGGLYHLG